MGGRKMEMDLRMTFDPMVSFGFMGTQIVHNHMDFFIRMFCNDFVDKIQELPAAPAVVMARFHLSRSYVQGGKQGARSMPSVLVVGSRQRLAMRQFKPSLSSLQRLNGWLFVQAQDQGILRRIKIKPNNIRGLARKFRIRRKTPTAPSLKANPSLAQHRPHFIIRDARLLPQKPSVPLDVSLRRRLINLAQNRLLGLCGVFAWLPGTRFIQQTFHAFLDETGPPFADPCDTCSQPIGNLRVRLPFRTPENDLRSFGHTFGSGMNSNQPLQLRPLFGLQHDLFCFPAHNAGELTYYSYYVN